MAIEYKFLKNIVTSPTADASGIPSKVVVTIPETLIKTEDEDSIAVSYNGQIIRKRTVESEQTFAKLYYEVANNNSQYLASSSGSDQKCNVTITIHANQDFVAPGYSASGDHQNVKFASTDIFYISFYHTVVRDV